jgi:hypothetical protein
MAAFCQASPVDVDPEVYLYLINASFSVVSSRGEIMSFCYHESIYSWLFASIHGS